jgi:hypothetical protein
MGGGDDGTTSGSSLRAMRAELRRRQLDEAERTLTAAPGPRGA